MKVIREMGKGVVCLLLAVAAGPVGAQTVEYIHTDALGTPVAVTNSAGVVVERSEYEPYGALLNRSITDGPGFTGHVQDAATRLTYMQQRYYDPGIGRFLSVDPVAASANTDTNFNRYWYANSNPYKFTDPDGRKACGKNTECRLNQGAWGGAMRVNSSNSRSNVVAKNGRNKGIPIRTGTAQDRHVAAERAVDRVRDGVQSIGNGTTDQAAKAFGAIIQPIIEKYGVEVEAVIDSPAEGSRLGGLVVGDKFRRSDGIGFTVNSPSNGQATVHGHPLSTHDANAYPPFSNGDLNWYKSSPGVPHYVTNPDGVFRYDGPGKAVDQVGR